MRFRSSRGEVEGGMNEGRITSGEESGRECSVLGRDENEAGSFRGVREMIVESWRRLNAS